MRWTLKSLGAKAPCLIVLCALACLVAAPASADYGFFRTVVGYAELFQTDSRTSAEVEANYPVLVGDRLEVSQRGRIEAVLADGSYLRVGGDSVLDFEEAPPESAGAEPTSILRLERGEIQLVLPGETRSGALLRIDTINATVYLETRGSYRIYSDGRGWTEVVVRDGYAEVVTERGSSLVRAGEQSTVNGTRWPKVTLRAAGRLDDLEIWGEELLAASRGSASPYVDPGLGYAAAPLARHGSWVYVGGRHAWQPAVAAGWRPYHYGYWGYTPAGLTWISPEPWGWVTYHYGTWDLTAGFGWVWYPGRVYTPAAVYWYWGPSHVAWVPAGYYHSYYRPHHYRPGFGFGFHFGVHGWAGGSISYWSNWTFCASGNFGRRGGHRYYSTGAEITRSGRMNVVPRGVITSDTRGITPDRWNKPALVIDSLTRNKSGLTTVSTGSGSLPDLTSWVSRSSKISAEAERALYPEATGRSAQGVRELSASLGSGAKRKAGEPLAGSDRSSAGWSRERRSAQSSRSFDRQPSAGVVKRQPTSMETPSSLRGRSSGSGLQRERKPEAAARSRTDTSPNRDWSREPADWSRKRSLGSPGSSTSTETPHRRELVGSDRSREPADWSRKRSLGSPGSSTSTGTTHRRELVGSDRSRAADRNRSGSAPSSIERYVRGGDGQRSSTGPDWRGQVSARPPAGVSGSRSTSTPPVRRVLDGVKSLRRPGGSGATVAPPPSSRGSIGSSGSYGSGASRGGTVSGSTRGSTSNRSSGVSKSSSGGGSRRSIRSSKGGGG